MDVPVVAPDLLLGHHRLGVKVAYFSPDLGVDARGIEGGDPTNPAATGLHAVPGRSSVVAERRDGTDASHHHPPLTALSEGAGQGISHWSLRSWLPARRRSTGRAG